MKTPMDTQISILRSFRSNNILRNLLIGMASLAVLSAIGAIVFNYPGLWIFCGFFVFVTIVCSSSVPHLKNAELGLDHGKKVSGSVQLKQIYDSDRYDITTFDDSGISWTFDVHTSGWNPEEETRYSAELYYLDKIDWPVLVITESTLLFPRNKPAVIKNIK